MKKIKPRNPFKPTGERLTKQQKWTLRGLGAGAAAGSMSGGFVGTVAGGAIGGIAGYTLFKEKKKKRRK